MGVFLDQRPLHLLDWDPVKISVGAREFLGDGGGGDGEGGGGGEGDGGGGDL